MLDRKRWYALNLAAYALGFVFILWIYPALAALIPRLPVWLHVQVPSDVSAFWLIMSMNAIVLMDVGTWLPELIPLKRKANGASLFISLLSTGTVQFAFWILTAGLLGMELGAIIVGLVLLAIDAALWRTWLDRVTRTQPSAP